SEVHFRLLVEAVTDYAIFLLDPRGRISSWNRGAERLKGYRAEEIIGQHFSCFYTQEDRALDKPAYELRGAAAAGRGGGEGRRAGGGRGVAGAQGRLTVLGQRGHHRPAG